MSQQHCDPEDVGSAWAKPPVVFKVLARAGWEEARADGLYRGSPDDKRDGFIHFSAAHQLEGTLAKYFRGKADHLLVAFDTDALGPELKWEPSRGGDLFPHLYGPLPVALALWQRPLELGADGVPSLQGEWLEC
ncbi:MAG: DUF952 domain-containing protein [Hyphomicrobium sp.]|nr:DUF952 domain-containing protein [Hyphomicrobium sp.]